MDIRDEYKEVYKNERKKINQEFYNKNYNEVIKLSLELLDEIQTKNISTRYNLWFIYYTLAETHMELKLHQDAIRYANIGKQFCDTLFEQIYCDWQLALCYMHYDKNRALKLFDRCISFYSMNNCPLNLGRALTHKGSLIMDESMIMESIKIYQEIDVNKLKIESIEIQRSYDFTYEKLTLLYIQQNNIIQAKFYSKKINDVTKKNNVDQLIRVKMFEPIEMLA